MGTKLAFFALVLAFFLAFVLALSPAGAIASLRVSLGFLGFVDDVLLLAVQAALAVRSQLSVSDVRAQRQLFLFGGLGKSSSVRSSFEKLFQVSTLLLKPSYLPKRFLFLFWSQP